jgi:hypothetical protein
MPSKLIPCSQCASETEIIEQSGNYKVTSCTPTAENPNQCRITWQRKTGAQAEALVEPPKAKAKPAKRKKN